MNANELFLQEQLEWTKKRMALYDAIENKLREMREIAEEAADNRATDADRLHLQQQIEEKQTELEELQSELETIVH
ncbi:hypothetical protein [Alkalicoccus daliensis]|uniref:Uncharacterized protein n=1 Tax=Alkalicoccus daliensis TaxID=745820 RepID=A0A1H0JN57_9BACI|nr:hypothetical protein [Alkalicoccus daliensis]SDO44960.1 hypothetical protein SAMN04488053_11423 [Alkalicoccus daliensis]